MKTTRFPAAALALAAIGLTSCTTSRPLEERSSPGPVCVNVQEINSYSALDIRHVVVNAGANDHFLLTLEGGCSGLTFAHGITVADASRRVCNDGFCWLSFDQPGVGAKRCRIVNVEPVADETAAKALVESRASAED